MAHTRNLANIVLDIVQASDPERAIAVSYARSERREALAALFALDITLGRVIASTTEPMIGAMRLAWWREALENLDEKAVPGEPVLEALRRALLQPELATGAELAAMIDGWLALIEVEPLDHEALVAHARERGERLFSLAGAILEMPHPELGRMGRGWALIDLASRMSQSNASDEAMAMASQALAGSFQPMPRALRPLLALASLARDDALAGRTARRVGSPARQLKMLRLWLIGR